VLHLRPRLLSRSPKDPMSPICFPLVKAPPLAVWMALELEVATTEPHRGVRGLAATRSQERVCDGVPYLRLPLPPSHLHDRQLVFLVATCQSALLSSLVRWRPCMQLPLAMPCPPSCCAAPFSSPHNLDLICFSSSSTLPTCRSSSRWRRRKGRCE
jgi:hypothetical protein